MRCHIDVFTSTHVDKDSLAILLEHGETESQKSEERNWKNNEHRTTRKGKTVVLGVSFFRVCYGNQCNWLLDGKS